MQHQRYYCSMTPSNEIIQSLLASPVSLDAEFNALSTGKLPDAPGLYAWWVKPNALVGLTGLADSQNGLLALLYVGTAPRNQRSQSTIRTRIVGEHLRGNTNSSTFRYSLASLLKSELRLSPIQQGRKVALPNNHNLRLTQWQIQHLWLTWAVIRSPWEYEKELIQHLQPPLNLIHNRTGRHFRDVSNARKLFRQSATPYCEQQ